MDARLFETAVRSHSREDCSAWRPGGLVVELPPCFFWRREIHSPSAADRRICPMPIGTGSGGPCHLDVSSPAVGSRGLAAAEKPWSGEAGRDKTRQGLRVALELRNARGAVAFWIVHVTVYQYVCASLIPLCWGKRVPALRCLNFLFPPGSDSQSLIVKI